MAQNLNFFAQNIIVKPPVCHYTVNYRKKVVHRQKAQTLFHGNISDIKITLKGEKHEQEQPSNQTVRPEPSAWIFHPDRTPRRDRDHRDPGGDAAAGAEQSQAVRPADPVRQQPQTDARRPAGIFQHVQGCHSAQRLQLLLLGTSAVQNGMLRQRL